MIDAITNESIATFEIASPLQPAFAVGDLVEIDGEPGAIYEIIALDYSFSWLYSPIEGYESAELSELRRRGADQQAAF